MTSLSHRMTVATIALTGFLAAQSLFAEPPAAPAKQKSNASESAKSTPVAPSTPAGPAPTVQLKPGEAPGIEFDTPIYDFGKMKTGKDVEHDFWFHNTGNGPLEIVQVKPSCGCTTTSQYDKVVQPGQSGKIPIKVATGHASGPISKSIAVATNVQGAGSTVTLQVKGELWQVIQATPNNALFGNISAAAIKEGSQVRKLTIANNTDKPAKLGEIKSSSPAFKGELKELEPGMKWEMAVTLLGAQPTGVQSGMLELDTGLSDLPKLQITCSAYMVADVDVVPNKMVLPAARTTTLQRDFYVRNNGSKPLHLSDLAASNPLMKMAMQETQTGMAYRITMDVPPEYKIPKDGDKITFKTDNSSYPTFTIPVTEIATPAAIQPSTVQAAKGVSPPLVASTPPPGKIPYGQAKADGVGKVGVSAVSSTEVTAKSPK